MLAIPFRKTSFIAEMRLHEAMMAQRRARRKRELAAIREQWDADAADMRLRKIAQARAQAELREALREEKWAEEDEELSLYPEVTHRRFPPPASERLLKARKRVPNLERRWRFRRHRMQKAASHTAT